jgi:hypothetical protein
MRFLTRCVVSGASTIVYWVKEVCGMKYVLMFCESEQWAKDWEGMSQEERDRGFVRVQEWLGRYADKITHNRKLADPDAATTVRLEGAEPVVTDGPFVEGKEVVSGYCEVDVADLDEALAMVRSWPACPVVEIRPVLM